MSRDRWDHDGWRDGANQGHMAESKEFTRKERPKGRGRGRAKPRSSYDKQKSDQPPVVGKSAEIHSTASGRDRYESKMYSDHCGSGEDHSDRYESIAHHTHKKLANFNTSGDHGESHDNSPRSNTRKTKAVQELYVPRARRHQKECISPQSTSSTKNSSQPSSSTQSPQPQSRSRTKKNRGSAEIYVPKAKRLQAESAKKPQVNLDNETWEEEQQLYDTGLIAESYQYYDKNTSGELLYCNHEKVGDQLYTNEQPNNHGEDISPFPPSKSNGNVGCHGDEEMGLEWDGNVRSKDPDCDKIEDEENWTQTASVDSQDHVSHGSRSDSQLSKVNGDKVIGIGEVDFRFTGEGVEQTINKDFSIHNQTAEEKNNIVNSSVFSVLETESVRLTDTQNETFPHDEESIICDTMTEQTNVNIVSSNKTDEATECSEPSSQTVSPEQYYSEHEPPQNACLPASESSDSKHFNSEFTDNFERNDCFEKSLITDKDTWDDSADNESEVKVNKCSAAQNDSFGVEMTSSETAVKYDPLIEETNNCEIAVKENSLIEETSSGETVMKDDNIMEETNNCEIAVKDDSLTGLKEVNNVKKEYSEHIDNAHHRKSRKDVDEVTEGVEMEGDDSWDKLYDDDGEALNPDLVEELSLAVGQVKVTKTQFDYYDYQPKDPQLDYEAYSHLIEIYDFPKELVTRDLVMAFNDYQDKGFDIKWVDDTHAIGVFSSSIAAQSAVTMVHPLMKVRPLSEACRQTKVKAKKSCEFLQPYKRRPETVASVARNLVAGALGMQSKINKEKRDEERKKIKEAREQKKAAKKQKQAAWDGSYGGKCAMDDC